MKKTVFSLMAILAAGAVFADPATENFGKSTVQTQLQVEVKDGVEKSTLSATTATRASSPALMS